MLPVRPATRLLLLQLAVAVLAGLALRPALGLHPVWWWAWLAPAPLLVLAYRAPARRARGLTVLAAGIGVSVNAPYFSQLMPLPAVIGTLVAQTLAWVFVVGASRRLVVRYQAWWTVLAYPVLWAGLDTLEAAGLPDGNWGSLEQFPLLLTEFSVSFVYESLFSGLTRAGGGSLCAARGQNI